MTAVDVKAVLDGITDVDTSKIEGINGVFLFNLSGEGGGKWTVSITGGKIELDEGETNPPDLTVSMSAQDFVAMSRGDLNAVNAFMQGKIKIQGDMSLAMRLQSILS